MSIKNAVSATESCEEELEGDAISQIEIEAADWSKWFTDRDLAMDSQRKSLIDDLP